MNPGETNTPQASSWAAWRRGALWAVPFAVWGLAGLGALYVLFVTVTDGYSLSRGDFEDVEISAFVLGVCVAALLLYRVLVPVEKRGGWQGAAVAVLVGVAGLLVAAVLFLSSGALRGVYPS